MRFLHIRHQLPHVAIQADVLLRFQLLRETDETRDQDLEDAGHDLTLNTARPVTTAIVGRRDAARRRTDVPAGTAHA